MKLSRLLLIPLMIGTLALSSGCRIRLSVTGDGTIESASGDFNCPNTGFCGDVSVTNTDFDETFIARPREGSVFVGWRRRDRGLCGGSTDDCRLFTSGFEGNDSLLAFLDSDEVFFLEALFLDDAGSGVGNASSCFNPALYEVGSSATLVIRDMDDDDIVEQTLDFLNEATTVRGVPAVDRVLNGTERELNGSDSETFTGLETFRVNGLQVQNLSEVFEIISPEPRSGLLSYSPFRLDRFDLAAGQSFTQEYTEVETFTENGVETVRVDDEMVTIRFDGIESVTVPAGTFDACRFTEIVESGQDAVFLREWIAVGSGIPIKSEEDSSTSELVSGSLNGVDI